MPCKLDFDLTFGILRCRLAGPVTDEVLRQFFQVGARYARRTHPSAGVVDLSEVSSFEVSAEMIDEIARTTPVLTDPELQRIVIAPTPQLFGMMRMFATQAEEKRPNLHVVRTEREAWAILGVPNPQFNTLDSK